MTETPRRRRTDTKSGRLAVTLETAGRKVAGFLDTYSRDVWLFVITVAVLVSVVLAAQAATRATTTAEDAKDDAGAATSRACVSIPIQVKALRGALAVGLITQRDFDAYRDLVPEDCKK